MSNWARPGPQPAVPDNQDEAATNVPTVADMAQRQSYWWKTVLTQTFRRCGALQTKHPELLTEEAWKTILTRLQIVRQSTSKATIERFCRQHKDLVAKGSC